MSDERFIVLPSNVGASVSPTAASASVSPLVSFDSAYKSSAVFIVYTSSVADVYHVYDGACL